MRHRPFIFIALLAALLFSGASGAKALSQDRIKRIQSAPALLAVNNVTPVRLNFTYDFLGRRVQKQVWNYVGGNWVLTNTLVFAYDGLNLIAEYHKSGSSLVLDKSYYWGLDKSSSLQGAGGIGGFLGMVTHSTPTVGKYAAINDPWGNVVGLFDLNVGIPVAEFEYTPFGEPLRAMGIMAANLPWRLSTKYFDRETGLLNFGCRYYSPSLGRFLNRDPKDELGRLQLSAPLSGGTAPVWNYIGQLVGVPGKSSGLTPCTSVGMAQSNERQDGRYRDSAEPGDIFAHRKGNPAYGGGNRQNPYGNIPKAPASNQSYGFVGNNPYGAIDPMGLFWSELFAGVYAGFAGGMDTMEEAAIFPFAGLELSAASGSFSAGYSAAADNSQSSGLESFGNVYDEFQNAGNLGGLELFGMQLPLIGNFIPGPQGDQSGDVQATVTSRGIYGMSYDRVFKTDNDAAQALGIRDNISATYVGGSVFQVITELFLGNTGPGLNYASQVSGQVGSGTIDQLAHSGGVIRSLIGSKFLGAYGIGVSENFSSQGPALGYFNNVGNVDWKLSPGFKEPTSTISWALSSGLIGVSPDVGWNNGLHIQPGNPSVWDAAAGQALRH
jgi:RHS repeat-associated protein